MSDTPARRDLHGYVPPMRAKGNLTYLQFILLVQRVWAEAHPEIPMVTSGADDPAQYPCIVYSLQLRKTHPNEPKMRYREEKDAGEDVFVVGGQRFQNIIYFAAVGEAQDVDSIEALIETFEEFMMEFTPVFKELGASELVYARRLADTEENRSGAGVVRRTVSYMVTTEKVVVTRYERLQEIVISARVWLDSATSDKYYGGTIYDNSPRYHLSGADAKLTYQLKQESLDGAVDFSDLVFTIANTNFRINDILYLLPYRKESDSSYLPQGFFRVTNLVGNPYDISVGYTLEARAGDNPDIAQMSSGMGAVYYFPEGVYSDIIDDNLG